MIHMISRCTVSPLRLRRDNYVEAVKHALVFLSATRRIYHAHGDTFEFPVRLDATLRPTGP